MAVDQSDLDAAVESLVSDLTDGVQSHTAGGETTVAMDPAKRAAAIKAAAAAAALSGTNANGGKKSAWGGCLTGRAVFPGPGGC